MLLCLDMAARDDDVRERRPSADVLRPEPVALAGTAGVRDKSLLFEGASVISDSSPLPLPLVPERTVALAPRLSDLLEGLTLVLLPLLVL